MSVYATQYAAQKHILSGNRRTLLSDGDERKIKKGLDMMETYLQNIMNTDVRSR